MSRFELLFIHQLKPKLIMQKRKSHSLYKVSLQNIFYTPLYKKVGAALVRTITSMGTETELRSINTQKKNEDNIQPS